MAASLSGCASGEFPCDKCKCGVYDNFSDSEPTNQRWEIAQSGPSALLACPHFSISLCSLTKEEVDVHIYWKMF